jgi:hypothetical protein
MGGCAVSTHSASDQGVAVGATPSHQIATDYLPLIVELDDLEDLFGALLVTGHSVQQAADFLIDLGNGVID